MFNFRKNFSKIILTISILILFFIFYKSEIYFEGNNRKYYEFYYLVSVVLIIFSLLTFFMSDIIKEYLIISMISFFITIYSIELFLNSNLLFLKFSTNSNKIDNRNKFEVYTNLKNSNNVERVSVTFPILETYSAFGNKILPLGSVSNSKTVYCNENGYYSIYHSDRYGFNNPDEEWSKNEIEYFLIGDSFVHGACVNRPHDIASVLRTLSNKSVLNLGYGSAGPLTEYARMREYLKKNIKKIIWIYTEFNDMSNLDSEIKNRILLNYLENINFSQNLKIRQNEIDQIAYKIIENHSENLNKIKVNVAKCLQFLKLSRVRFMITKKPESKFLPEFKKIIQLANELAKKNDSEFYFFYLPSNHTKSENYLNVKNVIEDLNIPFFDLEKLLIENEIEMSDILANKYIAGSHFTEVGYKKISEIIYTYTKN